MLTFKRSAVLCSGMLAVVLVAAGCGQDEPGGGLAALDPQPTLLAVQMGDKAKLEELLEEGVDPDDTLGRAQRRALEEAVTLEDPSYAQLLIDYGADVNYAPYHNWTYLHSAAEYGGPGVVELLLDAGVDPCKGIASSMAPMRRRHLPDDVRGMTALDIARAVNNDEVVPVLEETTAACP